MAVTELVEFFTNCYVDRATPNEFAKRISRYAGTKGVLIAKALVDTRASICPPNDPLPPRYLTVVLKSNTVVLSDVLLALIARHNALRQRNEKSPVAASPTTADIKTLQELAGNLVSIPPRSVLDRAQTRDCVILISKWMSSMASSIAQNSPATVNPFLEAVAQLLVTLSATELGVALLSEKDDSHKTQVAKVVGDAVDAAMVLFSAFSPQILSRLGNVQKHISLFGQSRPSDMEMQAMQFESNVTELQVVATRSGTTALLQELIGRGDTVGDNPIFGFLAGRHGNDYSAMFLDLLFAAFHVLSQSKKLVLQQIELYIRNRLPLTLKLMLQTSFESFSAEDALTTAWSQLQLTPETMPCAQSFVHVCSLHDMISPEKAAQIIDNQDLNLTKRLYSKDELLAQLSGHSAEKTEKLIQELLTSDGNGVVITEAITEIMVAYAKGKETRHLKDLARALVRKPDSLNAIALFRQPSLWISPLCTLLEEWSWDDIPGESQPLYDEFGGILLLILTMKRRLRHTAPKLAISGFVARYLEQEGSDQLIHKMSPEVSKYLQSWIDNFYRAEALSDDLTTNCSPQEFYPLVPLLMRESAEAHKQGQITLDELKGGLEYLLEPFLLPSLVSALRWCNNDLKRAEYVLPILTRDTKNEIHSTIVSMMQSPEEFAFPKGTANNIKELRHYVTAAVARPGQDLSLQYAVSHDPPSVILRTLIEILVSFWNTAEFVWALDLIATLICVTEAQDLRLLMWAEHAKIGERLQKRDNVTAEVIVHLYRTVQSYAGLLVVKEANIEIGDLPDVSPSQNVGQNDSNNAQGVDDIDQVLNESAALNVMDSNLDGGMDASMQGVDGLDYDFMQDDNMGLGNIDSFDLDLDSMF